MPRVVAIGASHELEGFALAGVEVVRAPSPGTVLDAWHTLAADVGLVILTTDAADAIGDEIEDRGDVLTAVMP